MDEPQLPVNDCQLGEQRHAYQTLGVPLDASAPSIKQTYRRLVRRWHPDLYLNGTPAHVEATHMTTLINEAYAAIAHAPLRYHIETYPRRATGTGGQAASPSASEGTRTTTSKIPKTDKLEFWVPLFAEFCSEYSCASTWSFPLCRIPPGLRLPSPSGLWVSFWAPALLQPVTKTNSGIRFSPLVALAVSRKTGMLEKRSCRAWVSDEPETAVRGQWICLVLRCI